MSRWQDIDFDKILEESPIIETPSKKEQDILDAAVELFAEKGFDRTSTAELSRVAKVSERTLYKYFPSKTDLLRRLVLPTILRFMVPLQVKRIKKVFNTADSTPKDLLIRFIADRLETIEKNQSHIKILIAELVSNPDLRRRFRPFFQKQILNEISGIVEQMQMAGTIRKDISKENIVRLLLSVSIGVVGPKLLFEQQVTENDIEEMGQLFAEAIAGH